MTSLELARKHLCEWYSDLYGIPFVICDLSEIDEVYCIKLAQTFDLVEDLILKRVGREGL